MAQSALSTGRSVIVDRCARLPGGGDCLPAHLVGALRGGRRGACATRRVPRRRCNVDLEQRGAFVQLAQRLRSPLHAVVFALPLKVRRRRRGQRRGPQRAGRCVPSDDGDGGCRPRCCRRCALRAPPPALTTPAACRARAPPGWWQSSTRRSPREEVSEARFSGGRTCLRTGCRHSAQVQTQLMRGCGQLNARRW